MTPRGRRVALAVVLILLALSMFTLAARALGWYTGAFHFPFLFLFIPFVFPLFGSSGSGDPGSGDGGCAGHCPECGAPFDEGAGFCVRCGRRLRGLRRHNLPMHLSSCNR